MDVDRAKKHEAAASRWPKGAHEVLDTADVDGSELAPGAERAEWLERGRMDYHVAALERGRYGTGVRHVSQVVIYAGGRSRGLPDEATDARSSRPGQPADQVRTDKPIRTGYQNPAARYSRRCLTSLLLLPPWCAHGTSGF